MARAVAVVWYAKTQFCSLKIASSTVKRSRIFQRSESIHPGAQPLPRAHATAVDAPRRISLLMPHFSRTPLSFLIVGPTYAEDGFSFLAG